MYTHIYIYINTILGAVAAVKPIPKFIFFRDISFERTRNYFLRYSFCHFFSFKKSSSAG